MVGIMYLEYSDLKKPDYEKEFSPKLTTKIINALRKGRFIGLIISGEFGKGKTSAAMQLAYDVYKRLNPDKTTYELQQMVLDHMLFTLSEVKDSLTKRSRAVDWSRLTPIEAIKKQKEIREPLYIWDDATIHASKHRRSEKISYEVTMNFDQIRDATGCMIITLPEEDELLKTIRVYRSFRKVDIVTRQNNKLIKLCFKRRKKKITGGYYWPVEWMSNERPVKLEDDWYGAYVKMRNLAKNSNIEEWEKKEAENKKFDEYITLKREYLSIRMKKDMKNLKDKMNIEISTGESQ
jgi:hypothetical protein